MPNQRELPLSSPELALDAPLIPVRSASAFFVGFREFYRATGGTSRSEGYLTLGANHRSANGKISVATVATGGECYRHHPDCRSAFSSDCPDATPPACCRQCPATLQPESIAVDPTVPKWAASL